MNDLKKYSLFFCSCFLGTLLFAQKTPRVIVLGFDGLGGYAFPKTNTPHLKSLCSEGSYTFKARAVLPTMSSPNWASMVNGTVPKVHRIKSNAWQPADIKNESFCDNPKGQMFPTVFRVLREQMPLLKMACVHDWDGFARLTEKDVFNILVDAKNEDETTTEAVKILQNYTPDLLFLHFDHVDHVGHETGHHTKAYHKAVEKADSLTGVIIHALKQLNLYDETYIIVTSDHGGILHGHGGISASEIRIPWIIKGPGIKKGNELKATVHQYDTAATIAKIFRASIPKCWMGKPVEAAFVN